MANPGDLEAESRADTRRVAHLVGAWVSLLLLPVFFFIGFGAAHLPYLIWPYEEGSGEEPLWFGGITTLVFFAILAIPLAGAVLLGRKVVRGGSDWGWVPIAIASLISGFFVVITVIGLASQILGDGSGI